LGLTIFVPNSLILNKKALIQELQFKAVRSSGPGGQHANKVASKVEVSFDVPNSKALSATEIERLLAKLPHRLNKDGILILQCDTHRSQHKNKDEVIARLLKILTKNLLVPKKRKPSKPTKSAIEKRLKAKKRAAAKKVNRRPPEF
jgi:ribosome-associated protein